MPGRSPDRRFSRYGSDGGSFMPAFGTDTRDNTAVRAWTMWPRLNPAARKFCCVALAVVGLPLLALAVGFFFFVRSVPQSETLLAGSADGIVVLTGGASRVTDALELLASNRGQRLLITGVHRSTGPVEIARVAPEFQPLFSCCVDLDRTAVNTAGNATETRRWVKERGFRSLIVVTSNYHMPRAMAELSHQLPDVVLIPFPVIVKPQDSWLHTWNSGKVLLFEYIKYLIVRARIQFSGPA
jgi:uncharacterized SAM-binding protein YcdF (DUF218 family)